MNDHRPTELELAAALRAYLPATAAADLRERIQMSAAGVSQQRPLPSVLGALTDADPDNGNTVSSGVYFYVLDAGKERLTRKLVLLK